LPAASVVSALKRLTHLLLYFKKDKDSLWREQTQKNKKNKRCLKTPPPLSSIVKSFMWQNSFTTLRFFSEQDLR
jgi:hypothetical protein